MQKSHVQKWGNSLGVRIPIQLAKKLNLHPGSSVEIEMKNNQIIIQAPQYDLGKMLDEITPKNRHHPIFDDSLMGHEEW